MDKTCIKCLQTFPVEQFSWKSRAKDKRQPYCKLCARNASMIHYRSNTTAYNDRALARYHENKQFLHDLKDRTPCVDCGVQYPHWVMDFDHLEDKKFTLSQSATRCRATVEKEVAKCDIVCANCHRQRTHDRSEP